MRHALPLERPPPRMRRRPRLQHLKLEVRRACFGQAALAALQLAVYCCLAAPGMFMHYVEIAAPSICSQDLNGEPPRGRFAPLQMSGKRDPLLSDWCELPCDHP